MDFKETDLVFVSNNSIIHKLKLAVSRDSVLKKKLFHSSSYFKNFFF